MMIARYFVRVFFGKPLFIALFLRQVLVQVPRAQASRQDEPATNFSENSYWIWDPPPATVDQDAPPTPPNQWRIFRRTVSFPWNGDHVEWHAKIAVDSKYWLWAAWQYPCDDEPSSTVWDEFTLHGNESILLVREGGLKRGPTPSDTWYDRLFLTLPYYYQECSSMVNHNHNHNVTVSIQILVWYFGKNGFSHCDSGHGGMILDGTITARQPQQLNYLTSVSTVSDHQWMVQPHPALRSDTDGGSLPNYRLAEHNIYYDDTDDNPGNQGGTTPSTDGTTWKHAIQLGRAGSPPWNQLWPREIPQWRDSPLQAYADVQVQRPASKETHSGSFSLVLQARLPYNAQFYPWIQFHFSNESNVTGTVRVDIQTDNYQSSGDTYLRATYITAIGPFPRTFESPSWINGHLVTYRISYHFTTPMNDPLPIPQVQFRETRYDTALVGSFHSNDPFLNTLWYKAQRTLLLSMRDNFMDCPDRERAQWWGDVTLQLGQVMFAFGGNSSSGFWGNDNANSLVRKAIFDLVRWQQPLPPRQHDTATTQCFKLHAPVPEGNYPRELPLQMLASIGLYGIFTYYWYTRDLETLQTAYPHIRAYLHTCWSMNATTGLVHHRKGDWDWKDWGENADGPILDNAWYVLALRAAIHMAGFVRHEEDVAHWQSQLHSIEQNLDAAFWTGESYQSMEQRQANLPPDDRSNALLVVASLVPTERFPNIERVLSTQEWASPYMEKYVLESLFLMRREDKALLRMKKRYHAMVTASNITTLWEEWDLGFGSYNHAWSGGPLILLTQYAAGVAPTSPGWRTYNVMPQEGRSLTHIQSTVPVFVDGKHDTIDISIEKVAEAESQQLLYKLFLLSPNNTVATVGIPRSIGIQERACLLHSVRINHSTRWVMGVKQELQNRREVDGVLFKAETDAYVLWQVIPGWWQFEGIADCTVAEGGEKAAL